MNGELVAGVAGGLVLASLLVVLAVVQGRPPPKMLANLEVTWAWVYEVPWFYYVLSGVVTGVNTGFGLTGDNLWSNALSLFFAGWVTATALSPERFRRKPLMMAVRAGDAEDLVKP